MTKEKIKKIDEKIRDRVENFILGMLFVFSIIAISGEMYADEMVHKFKNPSFSGIRLRIKNTCVR